MLCKMKCVSLSEAYNNGTTVKFQPVQSGSEENKQFYAATPSGNFEATLSKEAAKQLNLDMLGKEFYIDIQPA